MSSLMTVGDLCRQLEAFAPSSWQESWDNVGLLVGDRESEVSGVLLAVDITKEVLIEAVEKGCNVVISHHPPIFGGLRRLRISGNLTERIVIFAIKKNLSLIAAHTNLDKVKGGINWRLAAVLGLTGISTLQREKANLLKLTAFVPLEHVEAVRDAIFAAGAGEIGSYSQCSFSVQGEGTFLPKEDANPYVGNRGSRHVEPEQRIEAVLPQEIQRKVEVALIASHPYEVPAYDFYCMDNYATDVGLGCVGTLPQPMEEEAFMRHVSQKLNIPFLRHSQPIKRNILRVAVGGGGCSSLLNKAKERQADAFVTADVKYHTFFDAQGALLLVDAGHFETEQYFMDILHDWILEKKATFAVCKAAVSTNSVFYFNFKQENE